MNIELHIDRLVLDGLPIGAHDGEAVLAAVEAELARLLTEGGISSAWFAGGAVPSIHAGDVNMQVGATPTHLGAQIAGSIYSGIGTPMPRDSHEARGAHASHDTK